MSERRRAEVQCVALDWGDGLASKDRRSPPRPLILFSVDDGGDGGRDLLILQRSWDVAAIGV